jgi:hypothetical protein
VIQSLGTGAIGQSAGPLPPVDAPGPPLGVAVPSLGVVDPLAADGSSPVAADVPPAGAGSAAGLALPGVTVAERSFLAHPEPLKWIAGGANDFVIDPAVPQSGQTFGPWPWIAWTTSIRWPQREQT